MAIEPRIGTLVRDIQRLFNGPVTFDTDLADKFGKGLALKLSARMAQERGAASLRLSNLGSPCGRKLWYSVNAHARAERLAPDAALKFMYGDIIEEFILWLATEAGHTVERQQEEVNLFGVPGHIDAFIDGHLVDVKSCSTYSFNKFKTHSLSEDDSFGYITQLGTYAAALNQESASFLAIDKTLGHICLDTYTYDGNRDYASFVEQRRKEISSSVPPNRAFFDEPDGASGNRKLGVSCSYCSFKQVCWPGVRTFNYKNGYEVKPKYLTVVRREPKVDEAR